MLRERERNFKTAWVVTLIISVSLALLWVGMDSFMTIAAESPGNLAEKDKQTESEVRYISASKTHTDSSVFLPVLISNTSSGQATPTTEPNATATPGPTPTAIALPPGGTLILPPLPLGTIEVRSGPTDCDGQSCYDLIVRCDQISRTERVELRIGAPTGSASQQGTILFATGGKGNFWWDDVGFNSAILTELHAQGFRTIQIKWKRGWFLAEEGQLEDITKLACKPATVARWIYDNIHQQGETQPFCAAGHSNGASQLAYALTKYGLANVLDLFVAEGGPNWSRVDHSCIEDVEHAELYGDNGERKTIDLGFGFPGNGSGSCSQGDTTAVSLFQKGSLVFGNWQYYYPTTKVAFIIGSDDTTSTADHAMYYYNTLQQAGTPYLSIEVISGAPHAVTGTEAGMDAIQNTLLDECRIQPSQGR